MVVSTELAVSWKTSSHSVQTNCVEVSRTGAAVLVRDSKNPKDGALSFNPATWRAFINKIQAGDEILP
jgi:hypothetical protein